MMMPAFAVITVEQISGKAAFKEGQQWKPLSVNQKLEVGTKISTGTNSSVVLNIDGNKVTIRQLSMVRINHNMTNAEESNTNLGLKYGAINAKVKKIAAIRTQFKISTPVATSSVRGTEEEVSFGPQSGMIVKVLEGTVGTENSNGISNLVKGKLIFQIKTDKARPEFLLADRMGNTLVKLYLDSMTDKEQNMLEQFGFDTGANPGKFVTPLDQAKAKAVFKLTWQ
jgi:hypothetical protein